MLCEWILTIVGKLSILKPLHSIPKLPHADLEDRPLQDLRSVIFDNARMRRCASSVVDDKYRLLQATPLLTMSRYIIIAFNITPAKLGTLFWVTTDDRKLVYKLLTIQILLGMVWFSLEPWHLASLVSHKWIHTESYSLKMGLHGHGYWAIKIGAFLATYFWFPLRCLRSMKTTTAMTTRITAADTPIPAPSAREFSSFCSWLSLCAEPFSYKKNCQK